ncbi:MAG: non-canonical purine NTP pyrophosphatase, partial [Vulcanimicrobiaceae bacterium]
RYGGPDAGWAERRRLLLAELAEVPPERRTARFVCALHLVTARGREFAVERALPGSIVSEQRGSLGFSYDPLFALAADGPTFGELAEAEKNRISHRARAAQALVALVDGADRKM